jgi:Fic family protein
VIPFRDTFLRDLDLAVNSFEKSTLDPNIEKYLISKNELFASFAISKAENSALTLTEAKELWDRIDSKPDFNLLSSKMKNGVQLTQKDHDKLEFVNIVKTFRKYNERIYRLSEYTPELMLSIHEDLTSGLDLFSKYLLGFDLYKSGHWRDNNEIRVGSYVPPDQKIIQDSVNEVLTWIKNATNDPLNIGIFHTTLYAIHPFNNGNKRICRILEHMLYRTIGFNQKNLYGTSYYYHLEKERYYKHLLYSIEHANLNQFASYSLESLAYSLIGVFKTSLEIKKAEYLQSRIEDPQIVKLFTHFVKKSEIQFKNLLKITRNKVSRPTLVTYLQKATNDQVLSRRAVGKNVYYSLNVDKSNEQDIYNLWMEKVKKHLSYSPPEYKAQISILD